MRGVSRSAATVLAAAVLTSAIESSGVAKMKEPDGILGVKLGMTPEAFKRAYPKAVQEPPPTPRTVEMQSRVTFAQYSIPKQKVGPLRNCTLTATFFNQVLYQVTATCPEKVSKIDAYLEKQYGPAGYEQAPFKFWAFGYISVNYSSARRAFSVEDIRQSYAAGQALMQRTPTPGGPTLTPTVQETPASPTAAPTP
jgi:hypothetical protein